MASDDTTVTGIAGRYAGALFELATESGAVDAVKADLDRFAALVAESGDLARLVKSPVFTAEEQLAAITAVLAKAGIGGLAGNFLRLVARNRRLFAALGMIKAYAALVARSRGEVTAHVTVAEPLADRHLASLKGALKAVTSKDVQLEVKVDPAIIGGLIVQLGSRMVDASLKTKLSAMKTAMKGVR